MSIYFLYLEISHETTIIWKGSWEIEFLIGCHPGFTLTFSMGKKRCDSELVTGSLSHLLSSSLLSFHIYTHYFPKTTCCSGVPVLRSTYFCDFICLFFCLLNTNSMPTL